LHFVTSYYYTLKKDF